MTRRRLLAGAGAAAGPASACVGDGERAKVDESDWAFSNWRLRAADTKAMYD